MGNEVSLNVEIKRLESQFLAALPPHIPVERFVRVVMTAVSGNPELQQADRLSLFESAMKAAQDGLLPDGREGALVIFNTKDAVETKKAGQDVWKKKVQWMPMVAGILKKARNSGQISTIVSRVVYAGDKFRNWIDDDGEHIEYEASDESDVGVIRCVFAMAKLKDGSIEVEVMKPAEVEKVRAASKAKDGPAWRNWWEEMARKTVIRRLSKRLPLSSDLDDLIRRDDDLYDFKGDRGEPAPRIGLANPLKDDAPAVEHSATTGLIGRNGETDMDSDDNKSVVVRGNANVIDNADLAIAEDGSVLKIRDQGVRPEKIVDQRFYVDDQVFGSYAEWQTACRGLKYGTDFGFDRQWAASASGEATSASEGETGAKAAATTQTASPAAAAPATGQKPASGTKAPYEQTEESYMEYMRDEFDKATSEATIKDLWGKTRDDRKELLGADEMAALEKDRAAARDRIAKKGTV